MRTKETRKKDQRARLNRRNEGIRKEYKEEAEKGYRNDWIIQKLVKKYALSEYTLEGIVFRRGAYDEF